MTYFRSYKKFTKGKDLSNRTGEDMDSIFGRRKLKSDEEKVMEEDEPMNSDPATPDEVTDDEEIQVITCREFFLQVGGYL